MVTMFAERLRKVREERGLSQQQLAERVSVARVTITMYEAGEREPDFGTLTKLAQVLGVTTDYLLGRTDKPHPSGLAPAEQEEPWPEGVQVLRRASSKLTPEKKRFLIRLIEATLAEEEAERERGAGGEANHDKGKPRQKAGPGGPEGK